MTVLGWLTPILVLVGGYGLGEYLHWKSTSDTWNYVWMITYVGCIVASGWLSAMLLCTVLLGDDWRIDVLAGKGFSRGDAVDRMIQEAQDRSVFFFGMVILLSAGLLVGALWTSHNILFNYDRFAEPMTLVRSGVPEQQLRGLTMFTRDVDLSEEESEAIRDSVKRHINASSPEVRARAIWAAGQIGIVDSIETIRQQLDGSHPKVRSSAALSLARLYPQKAASWLMNSFPKEDSGVQRYWLAALGFTGQLKVGEFVRTRFSSLSEKNHDVALWAIGVSGDICQHDFLLQVHDRTTNNDLRCVIGDALKRISTISDVAHIISWMHPDLSYWCERQSIDGPGTHLIGRKDMLILSRKESLREKYMDAVFNTASDKAYDWYDAILRDDRYHNTAREHAYFLMQTWKKSPSRTKRTASGCDQEGKHDMQPPGTKAPGPSHADEPAPDHPKAPTNQQAPADQNASDRKEAE